MGKVETGAACIESSSAGSIFPLVSHHPCQQYRSHSTEETRILRRYALPAVSNTALVAFMTAQLRRDAPDEAKRKLFHFLDLEVNVKTGYEAASQNLVARLLETLGNDSVGRIIFLRRTIRLLIC